MRGLFSLSFYHQSHTVPAYASALPDLRFVVSFAVFVAVACAVVRNDLWPNLVAEMGFAPTASWGARGGHKIVSKRSFMPLPWFT